MPSSGAVKSGSYFLPACCPPVLFLSLASKHHFIFCCSTSTVHTSGDAILAAFEVGLHVGLLFPFPWEEFEGQFKFYRHRLLGVVQNYRGCLYSGATARTAVGLGVSLTSTTASTIACACQLYVFMCLLVVNLCVLASCAQGEMCKIGRSGSWRPQLPLPACTLQWRPRMHMHDAARSGGRRLSGGGSREGRERREERES